MSGLSPLSSDDRVSRRATARAAARRRRRLVMLLAAVALVAVLGALLAAGGSGSSHAHDRGSRIAGLRPKSAPGTRVGASAARPTPTRPAQGQVPALVPIAPAVPGTAQVYFHGPARNEIALTFDDGFCAPCVARLIRMIARTGAHATIFPNGVYRASWMPVAAEVRRLAALGQLTVGDHTYLHHDPVLEPSGAFSEDLSTDESWIERTFGVSARPFYRPPYGAYNSGTLQIAGALGFTKVIMWSGTLADSSPRSIPYLLHAIRYWAHPGAIILMHGNYPNTSIALPQILAILRARGLRPVTLRELLG